MRRLPKPSTHATLTWLILGLVGVFMTAAVVAANHRTSLPTHIPTAPGLPTATATTTAPQNPGKHTSDDVCEEDQPCWDCATMGNKQCGPATSPAPTQSPAATTTPAITKDMCDPTSPDYDGTSPTGPCTYTVKPGDTLSSIAPTYHTTAQKLGHANPHINPDKLNPGQLLTLPQS